MGAVKSKLFGRRQRPQPRTLQTKIVSRSRSSNSAQTSAVISAPVFLSAEDISHMPQECFPDANYGNVTWRTLLSSGITPTDSLTAGVSRCPAGGGFLGHHRHDQAELYFITEGQGMMRIDGVETKVQKGSLVFIPGNAEHGISNCSENGEDLVWFYCFACDGFRHVKYRFTVDEEDRC